jgi:carbon-monoxide dehydrogenase large subunit
MTSRTLAETSGPGLNASCYFFPKTVTWGFGTQAAVVAVDVDTCVIDVLRYVAVHDCGRAIHPVIIKGQLHGGVAQGLGAALSEALVYDDNGQLTTATLMEYGMPRADRVPPIAVELVEHPSAINELGIKGVGESGVIAPAAVVANAVEDALADLGVVIRDVPITPSKLFSLLR